MSVRNASQPSPARARQEKAREQARRDILLAAAQVFARRGYAASTLAELAQAAGFAAPSLYRYFGSKEEIFRSLVELVKADLQATFDAPVEAGPLPARLERLLTIQLEMATSRREIFALLLTTPPAELGGLRHVPDYRTGASLYERHLTEWMERHVAPGELRAPTAQAARALAAISHAFHHAHIFAPREGFDPAVEARLVVDLALRGIAATPAADAPAPRSTT
jgi:AcrR family transcriptional regulator